jgi:heptosyltransferase III
LETVLIFRIGSIGDTVVALPCFHYVARRFSTSRRILITDIPAARKAAPAEAILTNSGLIDGVIYFPASRRLGDLVKLRTEIRAMMSNTLIYIADRDLPRVLRDVCFFRWCGIREIIGATLSRDLRYPRVDLASRLVEPEAERLARSLSALGRIAVGDPAQWDLRLQPSEIQKGETAVAALTGRDYIAVNMGGKVESKDWGDERWRSLLDLMAKDYAHIGLVFLGSSEEFERSSRISRSWIGPSLNLCGVLSPRESAAAMRRAVAFVGHDSGPMHLAAAVGVTCVCMFGNFNRPKWWHPYGEQHRIIHDMRGVLAVAPSEVYEALQSAILTPRAQNRGASLANPVDAT